MTLSILLLAGLVIGGAASLPAVIVGAAFVEFMPLYAGDVLGPVVNAAQAVGVPVDDVDPTTPGVPSVTHGVILLLVLFAMPNGAAGLFRRLGVFTRRAYSRLSSSNGASPQGEEHEEASSSSSRRFWQSGSQRFRALSPDPTGQRPTPASRPGRSRSGRHCR